MSLNRYRGIDRNIQAEGAYQARCWLTHDHAEGEDVTCANCGLFPWEHEHSDTAKTGYGKAKDRTVGCDGYKRKRIEKDLVPALKASLKLARETRGGR